MRSEAWNGDRLWLEGDWDLLGSCVDLIAGWLDKDAGGHDAAKGLVDGCIGCLNLIHK